MSDKSLAILTAVIIALAGSDLFQAWSVLSAHLFTHQLPGTPLFEAALWLWFPIALIAVWCGFYGGYLAIRTRSPANHYLTVFAVLFCIVVKVSGFELGFSAFRLALTLGVDQVSLGLNFLGLALVGWLSAAQRGYVRSLPPSMAKPTPNAQDAA